MQQINVKKFPSSKWRWDLNTRPLEHESPPITTRPGLPPLEPFSYALTPSQLDAHNTDANTVTNLIKALRS